MSWIDQTRRAAFDSYLLANRHGDPVGLARHGGDLDHVLPEVTKKRAVRIGNELILSHEDAIGAIAIATDHHIAVLGLEFGEVLDDGFQAIDYTGYEFNFSADWDAFVRTNNSEAERWIKKHSLSKNHGYVATSTSEREFAKFKQRDTE